ncbi:hypothetical protein NBRC10512_002411 [Rhodotorula toruloides]|uniref:RHTO0S03e05974g1_1 n=2 Tax=Rhodotorula toruloides TaxID=5286 RepID=A0A061AM39_RHOTO|nr:vacuolar-sorting protein SNF8/VPS22 [Rhodotorula toruloides NP11]EMS25871.1 vacuolar-sorting protein SNF8/VPS22 [Rhodotorula toruloides NP11]CDR38214.1 RHTO0S03e05974g1_1 [Rhodotorula toruloides]
MARRAAGLSSLQRHLDSADHYTTLGTSLAAQQASTLSSQLSTFQSALSRFSSHHRAKILSNPEFRTHFSALCAELGVDPLGGGSKGLWDKMGLTDWYYALGVQVVDVCLRARERGGGLVALDEVIREVQKLRSGKHVKTVGAPKAAGPTPLEATPTTTSSEITEADVQRAIEALEPLGCGYTILTVGSKKVVRCSPGQLDRDSLVAVEAAGSTRRGAVTAEELREYTGREGAAWDVERVERALEKAVMDDGMLWVDEQAGDAVYVQRDYYAPGLFVME